MICVWSETIITKCVWYLLYIERMLLWAGILLLSISYQIDASMESQDLGRDMKWHAHFDIAWMWNTEILTHPAYLPELSHCLRLIVIRGLGSIYKEKKISWVSGRPTVPLPSSDQFHTLMKEFLEPAHILLLWEGAARQGLRTWGLPHSASGDGWVNAWA